MSQNMTWPCYLNPVRRLSSLMASLIICQQGGGHTEQIALWTEGEIGVDDANKSYNPCTYNGPPSSHKEQRNELGIASDLTLLNGVCLESALRAF